MGECKGTVRIAFRAQTLLDRLNESPMVPSYTLEFVPASLTVTREHVTPRRLVNVGGKS